MRYAAFSTIPVKEVAIVGPDAETLCIDKIALLLPDSRGDGGRFLVRAVSGLPAGVDAIEHGSALAARLIDGQTVTIEDSAGAKRLRFIRSPGTIPER